MHQSAYWLSPMLDGVPVVWSWLCVKQVWCVWLAVGAQCGAVCMGAMAGSFCGEPRAWIQIGATWWCNHFWFLYAHMAWEVDLRCLQRGARSDVKSVCGAVCVHAAPKHLWPTARPPPPTFNHSNQNATCTRGAGLSAATCPMSIRCVWAKLHVSQADRSAMCTKARTSLSTHQTEVPPVAARAPPPQLP